MNSITKAIAIDGPAGVGKSSVAKAVARELGMAYLDTGAMYRAATWWAIYNKVDMTDNDALADATRRLPLDMREENGKLSVLVDGQDISQEIRTPEITRQIFLLDQNADVRAHLVSLQQDFGRRQPTIAEGRDIGTVVFPKAKCKIFLEASLEERARRRHVQLREQGVEVDYEKRQQDIAERDKKSMEREASPLRCAEDAIRLDTSSMTYEEVVKRIVSLARAVL